ncbi:leucine rich adaptor protein 1-like [Xenopus laevis]|uniref:Leucine rich adaptor protein 1-like n=2 Tax=Xenopus laevis TaxID=8355 RepID=A0A1L8HY33_XENLA|nr:leucine rich adaptor protein 1-like [Xenopus laevis]OCU01023.1 hypothetical protein XELAEV_18006805mg [Xenopus laevis]
MAEPSLLDLRDIEVKMGRKVPESLAKSLREEHYWDWSKDGREGYPSEILPGTFPQSSSLERLESKIQLLKQDMVYLRATDVKLMRQLLIINENIESIKWMMEEKDIVTSQGSSLSGSLCSLLESQDTSLQGSCNSLQDCSDGMDEMSVGSYLDTLADIVPRHCTPSDFDQYSDTQENAINHQPISNNSSNQSDEYYCFR